MVVRIHRGYDRHPPRCSRRRLDDEETITVARIPAVTMGVSGGRDFPPGIVAMGLSAAHRGRFAPGLGRPCEWKVTVMGRTRVKEPPARRSGDRGACPLCNPRPDRVSMDRLWAWSMEHSGLSRLRATAASEVA